MAIIIEHDGYNSVSRLNRIIHRNRGNPIVILAMEADRINPQSPSPPHFFPTIECVGILNKKENDESFCKNGTLYLPTSRFAIRFVNLKGGWSEIEAGTKKKVAIPFNPFEYSKRMKKWNKNHHAEIFLVEAPLLQVFCGEEIVARYKNGKKEKIGNHLAFPNWIITELSIREFEEVLGYNFIHPA